MVFTSPLQFARCILTTACLVAPLALPASPVSLATSSTAHGNPIRPVDSADPGVVRADGKWYMYHTSGARPDGRYPIVVSDDLTSWTQIGYILDANNIPRWAAKTNNWWAPEVHKVGERYIAYYTTREAASNRFVIGAALASSPAGPFRDVGAPIVRNPDVGLIDVSVFQDPNTNRLYIIWKEDQNAFNPPRPTPLIMSEMTPDGLRLKGTPKELLRNTLPWEGVLVEAPSLVFHDGWYYLFYSANGFADDAYAVGVARSRDLWGPYVKKTQPILSHDKNFSGPGHQFVIQDENGQFHMFYHARVKSLPTNSRFLMHDVITWGKDGWPQINNGHPGGPLNQNVIKSIQSRLEHAQRLQDRREAAARKARQTSAATPPRRARHTTASKAP